MDLRKAPKQLIRNLSRALGDFIYKAHKGVPADEQKVISVPEVEEALFHHFSCRPRRFSTRFGSFLELFDPFSARFCSRKVQLNDTDRFLVLASDGVFEVSLYLYRSMPGAHFGCISRVFCMSFGRSSTQKSWSKSSSRPAWAGIVHIFRRTYKAIDISCMNMAAKVKEKTQNHSISLKSGPTN